MIPIGFLIKNTKKLSEVGYATDQINASYHMKNLTKEEIIFLHEEAHMNNSCAKGDLNKLLLENAHAKSLYSYFVTMNLHSNIIENSINIKEMEEYGKKAIDTIFKEKN